MLKTKTMDRLCCGLMAVMMLVSVLLWGYVEPGQANGGQTVGYEQMLFDQSRVHTLDIVMEDWDGFIANAAAEEYVDCNIIIDDHLFYLDAFHLGHLGCHLKVHDISGIIFNDHEDTLISSNCLDAF